VRKLIVIPKGGLCNRLLAVASAARLAEKFDRKLSVRWVGDAKCGCELYQLFYSSVDRADPLDIRNASLSYVHNFTPPEKRGIAASGNAEIVTVESYTLFYDDSEWEDMAEGSKASRPVAFSALKPYMGMFTPLSEIEAKIKKVASRFSSRTVGVHVRRGDHLKARQVSTIQKFIEEMKIKVEKDPETDFFVCTDDIDSEKTLRRVFPGKVLSFQKSTLARNNARGIQEAVVDLWSLAETREILGSFGSTFSLVASLIGRIDYKWVQ